MPALSKRWKRAVMGLVVPVVLIGLFTVVCLWMVPRSRNIASRQMSYHIEAGDVARGMITSVTPATGRAMLPIRPHHLTFTSSNGPVDVLLRKFDLSSGVDSVQDMLSVTEAIRNGQLPDGLIARALGADGAIPLHSWPIGRVHYMIYLRPSATSDVTVQVHYKP